MIKIYFILFIIYSIIGWTIEVFRTYDKSKGFMNRGFLIGPYCPIYGTCCLMMYFTLNRINNVILLFILSLVLCCSMEYLVSYVMEKLFNARWWDYSEDKFNLNGRICLENALWFGLLGTLFIKYINKFVLKEVLLINGNVINIIFYVLLVLFIIDIIVSLNLVTKITKNTIYLEKDNTRELVKRGKEIIKKTIFGNYFMILIPKKIKETKEMIKIESKKIHEKTKKIVKRK